jgi:hypothetical protein
MKHLVLALLLGGAGILAGCGGSSKTAKDPSEGNADPTAGEPAPKWDDTSESAENAHHPRIASNASSHDDSSKPEEAPPPPQSTAPKAHRDDEYDKEATESVLKRATRVVHDNCGAAKGEDGKATGPWGKTTLTLNLGHNGHPRGVTLDPSFEGKPAGRCITQAFTGLSYPPWRGADTTVQWEVELVQPK